MIMNIIKEKYSRCVLCSAYLSDLTQPLCTPCFKDLPWLAKDYHKTLNLEDALSANTYTQDLNQDLLPVYSAFYYQYPINILIPAFKYQHIMYIEPMLSMAMVTLKLPHVNAIVPIPLSSQRLVARGFNQSLLIAQSLSKALNIPIWQGLSRKRHTLRQQSMSRSERLFSLEDAFAVTLDNVPASILLVDDVCTTGATLLQAAKTLRKSGATQLVAATVAQVI